MVIVYKITNTETNRILVGVTSKTLKYALSHWLNNCTKSRYADYVMTKDVKQYGRKSFVVEQIDVGINTAEAQEIADNYIDQYQSLEKDGGYNKNYLGIRKRNPDYYEKRKNNNDEVIVSIDENISLGKKNYLEREMRDIYGVDDLMTPTVKKNIATPETVAGLRKLADDLEKYGNVDVLSVIPKDLNIEIEKNGKNISKILSRRALLNPEKEYVIAPAETVLCIKCGKYKAKDLDMYQHVDETATFDGYIHICKECLANYSEQIYEVCQNPIYTMISIAQIANILFYQEIAEKAAKQWEENKDNPREIAKYYLTSLRAAWNRRKDVPRTMIEFRNSNFVGDIFSFEEHHPATPRVMIKELNQDLVEQKLKSDKSIAETMEAKWGKGFKADEYETLEKEYVKLEKFLPKKTELHAEALKKYVIYNYKEKQALSDGRDLKEVKEWSSLADKAADNAQLKIKQLSADFGEGVDSFAQLAEVVEEYNSAIPTLPKARKMPYDDMDFIIWQIVNYIRRLEGKPETTYEEVYNFYDEELTKKMKDSGMTDDQIIQAKDERNAVFKDLSDAYQEPLWLLPTLNEDDEDDDDEEGGL